MPFLQLFPRIIRPALVLACTCGALLSPAPANAQAQPPSEPRPPSEPSPLFRTIGIAAIGGTGILALGGGAFLGIKGLSLESDLDEPRDACENQVASGCTRYEGAFRRAEALQGAGRTLAVVGTTALSFSALALMMTPPGGRGSDAKVTTVDALYGTAAALSLGSAYFSIRMLTKTRDTTSRSRACTGGDLDACSDARARHDEQETASVGAVALMLGGSLALIGASLTDQLWENDVVQRAVLLPAVSPTGAGGNLLLEF